MKVNCMKFIFYVEKAQIEQLKILIPGWLRSKKIREFLKNNADDINLEQNKIQGKETITFNLDDETNKQIDLLARNNNCNRSDVMRAILNALIIHYTNNPLEIEKGVTRTFTVAEGTVEKLKMLAPHGERDAFIEDFLLNDYTGPKNKTIVELKSRPRSKDTMLVTLTEESLTKLEQIAETLGNKVKRSHIFKDCIEQLIDAS